MRKGLMKFLGAFAVGSMMVATVPAQARDGHRGYSSHRDGYRDGYRGGGRDYRGYRGDYRGHRGYRDYRGPRVAYRPAYRGYYGPRYYDYGPRYYGYRDRGGDALLAGIVGLAVGAAIASNRNDRDRYYDDY